VGVCRRHETGPGRLDGISVIDDTIAVGNRACSALLSATPETVRPRGGYKPGGQVVRWHLHPPKKTCPRPPRKLSPLSPESEMEPVNEFVSGTIFANCFLVFT
jgi:hypothetical protein